jgi:hypothetical protein
MKNRGFFASTVDSESWSNYNEKLKDDMDDNTALV